MYILSGIAKHYGIEHGLLKFFLELPELVERKRNALPVSILKVNPNGQNEVSPTYTCNLCTEILEFGSHDKAIDHFSLHLWCDSNEIHRGKNGTSQFVRNYAPSSEVFDTFENSYGLQSWLCHHKASLGASYEAISKKIRLKFAKRYLKCSANTCAWGIPLLYFTIAS